MKLRAVSDRVTVIRRGKSIDTVTIEGSTNADLAEMMVGHQRFPSKQRKFLQIQKKLFFLLKIWWLTRTVEFQPLKICH